jgi:putative SOS response-associated peptidase YedK
VPSSVRGVYVKFSTKLYSQQRFVRYYEWLSKGKDKLPHFTKHKGGRLMLMAGLYDCVTLEGSYVACMYLISTIQFTLGKSTPLWTFTIVTTSANKEFEWLHERQPVILSSRESLDKWLDTSSQTWSPELNKVVEPYHDSSVPLEW